MSVQTSPGTFVWLEPAFAHDFPPAEGAAYMDQQGQMFMPDTLLVRAGQPVYFRSSEDVLHNVRVIRSDKTPTSTSRRRRGAPTPTRSTSRASTT